MSLARRAISKLCTWIAAKPPEVFRPSQEDIYLVSFPRSGNTWMRVILSELLYGRSGESMKDLQRYVPDLYVPTVVDDLVPAPYHVVKSHSPCWVSLTAEVKRVIYLIRDPRDVVLSHYRYERGLGHYQADFDQFVVDWIYGRIWPCSWQEHADSWTGHAADRLGIEMIVVRYEDLCTDPLGHVGRVADFLDLDKTQLAIRLAVDSASVQRMRQREERGMSQHEAAQNFQFIGPASSGQWQHTLTADQLTLICHTAGNAMARHGYV